MSDKLTYVLYTKDKFAVTGGCKEKYQDLMKALGGRWNSRMRGGQGWLIHISKKKELEQLIRDINGEDDGEEQEEEQEEEQYQEDGDEHDEQEHDEQEHDKQENEEDSENDLIKIQDRIRSRKDQNKYHRENSEDERDDESDDNIDPIVEALLKEASQNNGKEEKDEVSSYLTPTVHSPTVHSPIRHSPIRHSPTVHSPTVHSPVQHTPIRHSPDAITSSVQHLDRTRITTPIPKIPPVKNDRKHSLTRANYTEKTETRHKKDKKHRKKRKSDEEPRESDRKKLLKEKIRQLEKEKAERRRVKKEEKETHLGYYKQLVKNTSDFRKLYRTGQSNYSSSESESHSSEDFPSPSTPLKRYNKGGAKKQNNHDELFQKIRELQNKVYELKARNKRLEAEIRR